MKERLKTASANYIGIAAVIKLDARMHGQILIACNNKPNQCHIGKEKNEREREREKEREREGNQR